MLASDSKPLRGKACLITGGARRLGRASALALAQAGGDVAITFRNSYREAQRTVVDLSGLGVRAFAFECDVTDEGSVKSMMKEVGRELLHRQFRELNRTGVGCDLRFEYPRTIPGFARSPEMDAPKVFGIKAVGISAIRQDRSENHSHGLSRRLASLGNARPLLFFESRPTHAHQSDGKSPGAGDCRKFGRSRHDRSGGEISGSLHATHGQTNSHAAERAR